MFSGDILKKVGLEIFGKMMKKLLSSTCLQEKKKCLKIVSKLVWLINYFNSVLDDINEDMAIAFKKIFRNGSGKYHKAKPIKLW